MPWWDLLICLDALHSVYRCATGYFRARALSSICATEQATYHLGDILANAITHGIGALLAIAGAVYLIAASRAAPRGTW